MNAKELRHRLAATKVALGSMEETKAVEKHELIEKLKDAAPSSDTQCVICMEEYEPGDALRVLRCGEEGTPHRFHLTCVDQWLYSVAAKERRSGEPPKPPACPLCQLAACCVAAVEQTKDPKPVKFFAGFVVFYQGQTSRRRIKICGTLRRFCCP